MFGWLPVGVLIVVFEVVFPSDNPIPFVAGFCYLMVAFPVIGAVASRACNRPWSWPLAGVTAGVVMAVLTEATYATVDNASLGIVGKQVLGVTLLLTVIGLMMGTIGAICAAEQRRNRPKIGRA